MMSATSKITRFEVRSFGLVPRSGSSPFTKAVAVSCLNTVRIQNRLSDCQSNFLKTDSIVLNHCESLQASRGYCGSRGLRSCSLFATASLQSRGLRNSCLASHRSGSQYSSELPVAERKAVHLTSLRKLLEWLGEAEDRAGQDAQALQDQGPHQEEHSPSPENLKAELAWMVEDAVAGVHGDDGSFSEAGWRDVVRGLPCPWREALCGGAVPDTVLATRLSVGELTELWRKRRLEERVPIQYILGSCHWRDLVLAVGPGCLIPRPETEQLIDLAEAAIASDPGLASGPWADLGTGSGALAVSLAQILLNKASDRPAEVWAVDASPEAARWANVNVIRHGLQDAVRVAVGKWGEPLAPVAGELAGILSNPPYIPSEKLPTLQAEVRRHEPRLALEGGTGDGLGAIVDVLECAAEALRPGGFLALETEGGHQAQAIADALNSGFGSCPAVRFADVFADAHVRSDYYGVPRFLVCYRA
uniref:Release factor glutamine methyltransferase n=1 Tax=Tetraselmis sp. GSL018 TaxID=582737 RepID=A0A061QT22_9CHLO|mmetsp:Transcript_142/g.291  ORF Transcript_142/g.291 Transcript_142/m.291 type:complete len:475 (-) Transcript_142:184-1608(-)